MSWLTNWLARGFRFRINKPWPGEAGLPEPMDPGPVTREEVQEEVLNAVRRKQKGGSNV